MKLELLIFIKKIKIIVYLCLFFFYGNFLFLFLFLSRKFFIFLIFDLEIILAFPFTAVLQKNQNIGKNNLLAFLYILIVGFIYELKEGALNIVKKPYVTEININQN